MPPFSTGTQLAGAITDLINTALLVPLILVLGKCLPRDRATSRLWLRMMIFVCVSCALGSLAHLFRWSFTGALLIWSFLFPSILASCNDFLRLGLYSFSGCRHPSKQLDRILNIALLTGWALLMILFLLRRQKPIRVMMVYAIATVIPGFFFHSRLALRSHRGAQLILMALLPLLFGAALMMLQTGYFVLILPFDHNSIMHLCITFSLVIFFFSARIWETEPG